DKDGKDKALLDDLSGDYVASAEDYAAIQEKKRKAAVGLARIPLPNENVKLGLYNKRPITGSNVVRISTNFEQFGVAVEPQNCIEVVTADADAWRALGIPKAWPAPDVDPKQAIPAVDKFPTVLEAVTGQHRIAAIEELLRKADEEEVRPNEIINAPDDHSADDLVWAKRTLAFWQKRREEVAYFPIIIYDKKLLDNETLWKIASNVRLPNLAETESEATKNTLIRAGEAIFDGNEDQYRRIRVRAATAGSNRQSLRRIANTSDYLRATAELLSIPTLRSLDLKSLDSFQWHREDAFPTPSAASRTLTSVGGFMLFHMEEAYRALSLLCSGPSFTFDFALSKSRIKAHKLLFANKNNTPEYLDIVEQLNDVSMVFARSSVDFHHFSVALHDTLDEVFLSTFGNPPRINDFVAAIGEYSPPVGSSARSLQESYLKNALERLKKGDFAPPAKVPKSQWTDSYLLRARLRDRLEWLVSPDIYRPFFPIVTRSVLLALPDVYKRINTILVEICTWLEPLIIENLWVALKKGENNWRDATMALRLRLTVDFNKDIVPKFFWFLLSLRSKALVTAEDALVLDRNIIFSQVPKKNKDSSLTPLITNLAKHIQKPTEVARPPSVSDLALRFATGTMWGRSFDDPSKK
ncbi:hypothetical protein GLOTRDRAFT_134649, partial [Gloeophyllum trabeum ATCC 11539]